MIERYYLVLQRVYKIITDSLQGCKLSKEIILQMTIKKINNIAGPNGLVPILLVFGAYLCMLEFDPLTLIITLCVIAIKNIIKEVESQS